MSCLGLTLCVFAGSLASAADPIPETPALVADSAQDSVAKPVAHKERTIRLEDRTVEGSQQEPNSVRHLDRQDLSQAATLSDLLAAQPGVSIRRTGGIGGFSELSLRQCPASQVEVRVDGVPWTGATSSTTDLGPFSLDGLERVEIRQATSQDADGRPVLDLISRRAFAHYGGTLGLGSFGERSIAGWGGLPSGALGVTAWWQQADNDWPIRWNRNTPLNPSDDTTLRLSNNGFAGGGAAIGWRPSSDWDASARWETSEKKVGILGDAVHQDVSLSRTSGQFSARRAPEASGWNLPVELSARRFASEWHDSSRAVDYRSNRESSEDGWDLLGSAGLQRDEGGWSDGWLRPELRWEQSDRDTRTPGKVAVTPDASRTSASVSAGWKGQQEGLFGASLEGTFRGLQDRRDFATSGLGVMHDTSTLTDKRWERRGQARLWSRWKIFEAWASGAFRERAPTFGEIYGDNGLTFANLSLHSEESWLWEIGSRLRWRWIEADLAGYRGIYRSPIVLTQLGSSPAMRYANDSGNAVWGLETGLLVRSATLGSVRANLTLQKATVRSDLAAYAGNVPAYTPTWLLGAEANTARWHGLGLGYVLTAQGHVWTTVLNAKGSEEPERWLHGVRLSWRKGPVSLLVACDNLLDRTFQDFQNAPLSGRSFRVRLDYDAPMISTKGGSI